MAFDARLTVTGLCLLVMDQDREPSVAELLLVDTADLKGHHRHHPYMAFLTDSRGNRSDQDRPTLEGWDKYVIGFDGRAITRVSLENTLVRLRVTGGGGFVRDGSMDRVPDLRRLNVERVSGPTRGDRIAGATSRIGLPSGTLSTSGEVRDIRGDTIIWEGVDVIAEFVHLHMHDISALHVDHGDNSFELKPVRGASLLEFGISNDPAEHVPSTFDGEIAVPHFGMFGRLVGPAPRLIRTGEITPATPACPCAAWIQRDFPFWQGE